MNTIMINKEMFDAVVDALKLAEVIIMANKSEDPKKSIESRNAIHKIGEVLAWVDRELSNVNNYSVLRTNDEHKQSLLRRYRSAEAEGQI